jgi:hypothetical protein
VVEALGRKIRLGARSSQRADTISVLVSIPVCDMKKFAKAAAWINRLFSTEVLYIIIAMLSVAIVMETAFQ